MHLFTGPKPYPLLAIRVLTLYYQSGQFLGVGDCEIFFRVRVGGDQAWASNMPSFGSSIAVPKTQTPIL